MFGDFLKYVGGATLITFALCIAGVLICAIIEGIKQIKYWYTYKHRFDKPPKAKCYCIDCVNHGTKTNLNECLEHRGLVVPKDWFCKDAKPKIGADV